MSFVCSCCGRVAIQVASECLRVSLLSVSLAAPLSVARLHTSLWYGGEKRKLGLYRTLLVSTRKMRDGTDQYLLLPSSYLLSKLEGSEVDSLTKGRGGLWSTNEG